MKLAIVLALSLFAGSARATTLSCSTKLLNLGNPPVSVAWLDCSGNIVTDGGTICAIEVDGGQAACLGPAGVTLPDGTILTGLASVGSRPNSQVVLGAGPGLMSSQNLVFDGGDLWVSDPNTPNVILQGGGGGGATGYNGQYACDLPITHCMVWGQSTTAGAARLGVGNFGLLWTSYTVSGPVFIDSMALLQNGDFVWAPSTSLSINGTNHFAVGGLINGSGGVAQFYGQGTRNPWEVYSVGRVLMDSIDQNGVLTMSTPGNPIITHSSGNNFFVQDSTSSGATVFGGDAFTLNGVTVAQWIAYLKDSAFAGTLLVDYSGAGSAHGNGTSMFEIRNQPDTSTAAVFSLDGIGNADIGPHKQLDSNLLGARLEIDQNVPGSDGGGDFLDNCTSWSGTACVGLKSALIPNGEAVIADATVFPDGGQHQAVAMDELTAPLAPPDGGGLFYQEFTLDLSLSASDLQTLANPYGNGIDFSAGKLAPTAGHWIYIDVQTCRTLKLPDGGPLTSYDDGGWFQMAVEDVNTLALQCLVTAPCVPSSNIPTAVACQTDAGTTWSPGDQVMLIPTAVGSGNANCYATGCLRGTAQGAMP